MTYQSEIESNELDGYELSPAAQAALDEIGQGIAEIKARNDNLEKALEAERQERKGLETRMNKRGFSAKDCENTPSDHVTTKDGMRINLLTKNDSFSQHIQEKAERPDHELSVGDIAVAAISGARNPTEKKALSEMTDPAGGYTISPFLSADFIDLVRANATAFRAGARTLAMPAAELRMVRLDSDPLVAWRQENANVAQGDPTFGQQTMQARSLACLVKISRELAEDSANASQIINQSLASAMAVEIDRAVIHGDGTLEPLGLINQSGLGEVDMGVNGGAITDYSPILDAIKDLEENNFTAPTAAIQAPRTKRAFSGLADTTGQPLRRPMDIENLVFLNTTAMPVDQTKGTADNASSIIVGDFSRLIVGMRSEVRIEVLRERFADNLQIALLAWARLDVMVTHQKAFSIVKGVIPV